MQSELISKPLTNGTSEDYYLLQALPDQIKDNWHTLKLAIQEALPEFMLSDINLMPKVLTELLERRMQCWILAKVGELNKPLAVCTTSVMDDALLKQRVLFVFTLFGIKQLNVKAYKKGFRTLRQYAKETGCNRITGYTNQEAIVTWVNYLGGNTDYRLVTLELDDENLQ